MGQWSKSFPYPSSSRQSPSASNTWPLTPSPTGTEIESPVSITSTPRTSPSVGCIEMVRTRLSPRCSATSSVNVFASDSNVTSACRALNSSGTEPRGNSTSTTGPVIRTTRPLVSVLLEFFDFSVCLVVAAISSSLLMGLFSGIGERVCATDDFADFLGDLGLPFTVGLESQGFDEIVGVVARRLHCPLTRCQLGRSGLEQRRIHAGRQVARQQRPEQRRRIRLE